MQGRLYSNKSDREINITMFNVIKVLVENYDRMEGQLDNSRRDKNYNSK
jgi:hypothetical protein